MQVFFKYLLKDHEKLQVNRADYVLRPSGLSYILESCRGTDGFVLSLFAESSRYMPETTPNILNRIARVAAVDRDNYPCNELRGVG